MADTSVRELTELLPVILSTHSSNMRIIIHAGSFDILWRKTDSEIQKKVFSLQLENLNDSHTQHVFISGPIPNQVKRISYFCRYLGLNAWPTLSCLTHGRKLSISISLATVKHFEVHPLDPHLNTYLICAYEIKQEYESLYEKSVWEGSSCTNKPHKYFSQPYEQVI